MTKKNYKYGFALTELLVSITIMAVLSLLVVFAVAKKTQKRLTTPSSGRIICYRDINGQLHQVTKLGDRRPEERSVTKCEFDIPAYFGSATLYVIGGGGGGAPDARHTKDENNKLYADNIVLNSAVSDADGSNLETVRLYEKFRNGHYAAIILYNTEAGKKQPHALPVPSSKTLEASVICAERSESKKERATSFSGTVTEFSCPNGQQQPASYFNIDFVINGYTHLKTSVCNNSNPSEFKIKFDDLINNSPLNNYFNKDYIKHIVKNKVFNDYNNQYFIPQIFNYRELIVYGGEESDGYELHVNPYGQQEYVCYGTNPQRTCSRQQMENLKDDIKCNKFYDYKEHMKNGELVYAEVKKIESIENIPYGNPGSDGKVGIYNIGNALAGRNVVIDGGYSKVGYGGDIGEAGGETVFNFEGINVRAEGGYPGHIRTGSIDAAACSTIREEDKLGNGSGTDHNLKSNNVTSLHNFSLSDSRRISEYYSDPDNISGIVDLSNSILPNSVCNADGNITGYDAGREDDYNLNYGGGGGGYLPCMQYGCIAEAKMKYYNREKAKETTEEFTGTSESVYKAGSSTKGMGGAIIIKWGK